MTPSELKANVEGTGSHFFDRNNMRFAGDTMRNYGVTTETIKRYSGDTVECWELYRKKPVKHGLNSPAYFHKETFERVHGEIA